MMNNNLPYTHRILLENLKRNFDGINVSQSQIDALENWEPNKQAEVEIQFTPNRVVMQDFTGVPCVVDLASMRDAFKDMGGDPQKINPQKRTDLIIDHSVQIDCAMSADAFDKNLELDYLRNSERYQFLKWGGLSLNNFTVVPPATGIIHQINIEALADVITLDSNGQMFPDTCIGTDSHTTMVNALGVLGWGVGGIEAEAVLLGQSIPMLIPQVVGFEIIGKKNDSITTTDIVLTITEMLRKKGVVGKFVEFYGDGVADLSLADRATISNMCPEFGATAAVFAIDQNTIDYLKLTNRSVSHCSMVKKYAKDNGLWASDIKAQYSDNLKLDLATVQMSIAGPSRPQDRMNLSDVKKIIMQMSRTKDSDSDQTETLLQNNAVVIASITSCTNTSNPDVLISAGLLAKAAFERGLRPAKWVRTSLAPGSKVVTKYLQKADLQKYFDKLGFNTVGYGCATCIGNSGPLDSEISKQIQKNDLSVAAVLSGNRNFEGRINPDVKLNFLASPPLVVAYALAGKIDFDFESTPLGQDSNGKDVYLKDIWPSSDDIKEVLDNCVTNDLFESVYSCGFEGDSKWQSLNASKESLFKWDDSSTYIRQAPYFKSMTKELPIVEDINNAKVLAILGDSVTTDHISPAGNIALNSEAAKYLIDKGLNPSQFNSYGSRRGNHEVMVRGTFANIRLNNLLINRLLNETKSGGYSVYKNKITSIYQAACQYQKDSTPTIVIAGKEYGTGSSRDWAAKGTALLGVKVVIAESFERIHRSNLIGMGVLPLEFINTDNNEYITDIITNQKVFIKGDETFEFENISDLVNNFECAKNVKATMTTSDNQKYSFYLKCRIDTYTEAQYYKNGGILQYVLRSLL